MANKEWTVSQRIELCTHIVPLLQSGLPIDRGLKSIAADLPKRLSLIANAVQSRLENGEPLQLTLGAGTRPESRSLSATIDAGEICRDNGALIESWAAMQTAMALAKKRFRFKLVYPVFLVFVTVFAIGYAIHSLVPQYRTNLESIHARVPSWFEYTEFVNRHISIWAGLALILCWSPIFYFVWRRSRYDKLGWPADPAYRSRLQAHASALAATCIEANVPTGLAKSAAVRAMGIPAEATSYLDPASQSVFDLLERGLLDPAKAVSMQQDISKYLQDRSEAQVESQGSWITYSVTISVALVVGLSYLLVLYLPWLYLLDQLKEIKNIR